MGVKQHGPARGLGVSSTRRTFSPQHCLFQVARLVESLWTVVFLPLQGPARSSAPVLVRRDQVTATWFKKNPKHSFWVLWFTSQSQLWPPDSCKNPCLPWCTKQSCKILQTAMSHLLPSLTLPGPQPCTGAARVIALFYPAELCNSDVYKTQVWKANPRPH